MGVELARAFIAVRADASKVASDIRAAQPGIESAVGGMAGALQGAFSGLMALGAGSSLIGMLYKAGEFEATNIAFETMIGSVEETQKTLSALTEFAAKTPFEMPEILQASRGLIQFGERGDDLMRTLNMLGNAASGASTPFGFVALVFNQIRGVGKLLTQDFRQLSTRGILSLADIAKYYNVTTEAAQKMLSTGQIGFEDVRLILESLSKEGGRFYRLMERQSTSLLGLWSTLKDSINLVKREIGTGLMPVVKQLEATMINVSEAVREWVTQNRNLATGFALIATAAISLPAIGMVIKTLKFAFSGIGPILFRVASLMFSIKGILVGSAIAVVVYGIVTAFKKLGLTMDHVKAGMILLGDLAKGVGDFFMAIWEIATVYLMEAWNTAVNYISDLLEPIKTSFALMVNNIVANLDVMLGSWAGLRTNIVYYAAQAAIGFQAVWVIAENFMLDLCGNIKSAWDDVWISLKQGWVTWEATLLGSTVYQQVAGRLAVAMSGAIRDEAIKLFDETVREMQERAGQGPAKQAALEAERKAVGKSNAEQAAARRKVYEERMGRLGQESLDLLNLLNNAAKDMPKLSEKWKAALDAVKAAVGGVPGGPEKGKAVGPEKGLPARKRDWAFEGSVAVADVGRKLQDALLKPKDKQLAELQKGNALQAQGNVNLAAMRGRLEEIGGLV